MTSVLRHREAAEIAKEAAASPPAPAFGSLPAPDRWGLSAQTVPTSQEHAPEAAPRPSESSASQGRDASGRASLPYWVTGPASQSPATEEVPATVASIKGDQATKQDREQRMKKPMSGQWREVVVCHTGGRR